MPLSNLFSSAAGTCPFCNQKAGILSRETRSAAGPDRPASKNRKCQPTP